MVCISRKAKVTMQVMELLHLLALANTIHSHRHFKSLYFLCFVLYYAVMPCFLPCEIHTFCTCYYTVHLQLASGKFGDGASIRFVAGHTYIHSLAGPDGFSIRFPLSVGGHLQELSF